MEQEAKQHQSEHTPVTFYQLRKELGTERSEYLFQHIHRVLEIGVAEEYPAEAYKMESDDNAEHTTPTVALLSFLAAGYRHPHFMQCQRYAVECSPKDKIPGCSMP